MHGPWNHRITLQTRHHTAVTTIDPDPVLNVWRKAESQNRFIWSHNNRNSYKKVYTIPTSAYDVPCKYLRSVHDFPVFCFSPLLPFMYSNSNMETWQRPVDMETEAETDRPR